MRRVLLAMSLAILPCLASADDAGWARTGIGAYPFAVELPGPTDVSHEAISWGIFGTTESDKVATQALGGTLEATVTQAPVAGIRLAGESLIHVTTRGTVLKRRKATMKEWKAIKRGELVGKRLTYVTTVNGKPMRGVMEVFVSSPHILTLDVVLPVEQEAGVEERFFTSLIAAK